MDSLPPPERLPFPPAGVQRIPAFPQELEEQGGNILLVWTFLHTFADSLGDTCPVCRPCVCG